MGLRRNIPVIPIRVYVPEELYFRFERLLTQNFAKKPQYGLRSQVICALIERLVNEREHHITTESPNV
jgi:hypothetical protein